MTSSGCPSPCSSEADLDWMGDEGRVVGLPVLIRVAGRGERERGLRHWQSRERMRSHGGAARDRIVHDAVGLFSVHAHEVAAVSGHGPPGALV